MSSNEPWRAGAPAPRAALREPVATHLWPRVLTGVVLGLAAGAFGITAHRSLVAGLPIGLVIGLALALSLALMMRAWVGLPGLIAAALGWFAAVQLLSLAGPGGDVLVLDPAVDLPLAQAGAIFTYLGAFLYVAVGFAPSRWFATRPEASRIQPDRSSITRMVGPAQSDKTELPDG